MLLYQLLFTTLSKTVKIKPENNYLDICRSFLNKICTTLLELRLDSFHRLDNFHTRKNRIKPLILTKAILKTLNGTVR